MPTIDSALKALGFYQINRAFYNNLAEGVWIFHFVFPFEVFKLWLNYTEQNRKWQYFFSLICEID